MKILFCTDNTIGSKESNFIENIKICDFLSNLNNDVFIACIKSDNSELSNQNLNKLYGTNKNIKWIKLSEKTVKNNYENYSSIITEFAKNENCDCIYTSIIELTRKAIKENIKVMLEYEPNEGKIHFTALKSIIENEKLISLVVSDIDEYEKLYALNMDIKKLAYISSESCLDYTKEQMQKTLSPYKTQKNVLLYTDKIHYNIYNIINKLADINKEVNFYILSNSKNIVDTKYYAHEFKNIHIVLIQDLSESYEYLYYADALILLDDQNTSHEQISNRIKIKNYIKFQKPIVAECTKKHKFELYNSALFFNANNLTDLSSKIQEVIQNTTTKECLLLNCKSLLKNLSLQNKAEKINTILQQAIYNNKLDICKPYNIYENIKKLNIYDVNNYSRHEIKIKNKNDYAECIKKRYIDKPIFIDEDNFIEEISLKSSNYENKKLNIIFICDKKNFTTKMSRFRFHSIAAISKISNLIWSGPGWDRYNENKSISYNINKIYENAHTPDIAIIYKPLSMQKIGQMSTPICLRYNEMYDLKWTTEEIIKSQSKFIVCHHYNDFIFYSHLFQKYESDIKFTYIPHCAEKTIYKDYNLDKVYDILLVGKFDTISKLGNHYPFRLRLFNIIQKMSDHYKCGVLIHPGYENENAQFDQNTQYYAQMINQSKICITCSGITKSRFGKYVEIPMSGSVLAADIPDDKDISWNKFMIQIDNSMSDSTIIEILKFYLENDHAREILRLNGLKISSKFSQEYYASQFINKTKKFLTDRV